MRKNKLVYLGYGIGIACLVLVFALDLSEMVDVALTLLFGISVTISYVLGRHHYMLNKDLNYKIEVQDERNIKIRDKVNATMAPILLLLMSTIAVVCLSIKAFVPAILLILSVASSPIIMIFINRYYEKKY